MCMHAPFLLCAQVNNNRIPLTDNAVIEAVSTAWAAGEGGNFQQEGLGEAWAFCRAALACHPMGPHPHAPAHSSSQSLGKYGITCIEDLIHEIYTVGPAFKQASNFLWPFKLSCARECCETGRLLGARLLHGLVAGNREEKGGCSSLVFWRMSLTPTPRSPDAQWAAWTGSAFTTSRVARPETGWSRSTSWSPGCAD